MTGILEGLVYLHEKSVVHLDLKAANILTTKDGKVKLSDFGVSREFDFNSIQPSTVVGTPYWSKLFFSIRTLVICRSFIIKFLVAPEIIELKSVSTAADIWSLGSTIIELITGKPPYADSNPMTALFRIVEDDHPPLPATISDNLKDFLLQCFRKDADKRPTATELLNHPWIAISISHSRQVSHRPVAT